MSKAKQVYDLFKYLDCEIRLYDDREKRFDAVLRLDKVLNEEYIFLHLTYSQSINQFSQSINQYDDVFFSRRGSPISIDGLLDTDIPQEIKNIILFNLDLFYDPEIE